MALQHPPIARAEMLIRITASGFTGSDDEQVAQALDSTGSFRYLPARCRAILDHGVALELAAGHNPDAHVRAREGRRWSSESSTELTHP